MRRIKTLYCVAVIAIAIVLSCTGGLIGWITSIVVLAGALPMFRVVRRASAHAALIGFRSDLSEDTPQNQSTDQVSVNR